MSILGGHRGEHRGEISLSELLAALQALPWKNDDDAAAIARALGFGLAAREVDDAPPPTPVIFDHSQPSSPQPPPQIAPPREPGWAIPPIHKEAEELPADALPADLAEQQAPEGDAPSTAPAWLHAGYDLVEPEPGVAAYRHALLPARTARGVLSAALASWRSGSEIDVAALTRRVAERCLADRLPLRASPSLHRGCQLLLDFSDTMVPWWDDLRDLARQAGAVLGSERVATFHFAGRPAEARRRQPHSRRIETWTPEPGRPILVASDCGICGIPGTQRAPREWRDFVQRCAAADSPLLILVPWSSGYWPRDLGLHPQLVHWHPATSAAMLRRQRGLGHRVAR